MSELSTSPKPIGSSHPAVGDQPKPVLEGPLSHFETLRPGVLADVVNRAAQEFSSVKSLELLLGEALYTERVRLKRERAGLFSRKRIGGDRALWNRIQSGLLQSAAQVDRAGLLRDVIGHYAEEIGGHFDARVYRFATRAVPWGFSWLLNAASVRRFLPWGLTESLETRIRILGEVPAIQNLARKGTILLVPTHQSNLDSILIGYIIYRMGLPPFAYGAGLNLFSSPILSFFMSNLGAYTVDRKKSSEIYKQTLKTYSTRILAGGIHSIFFPGGGRSRSGAIESKLKLGLLGTALAAQIDGMRSGNPKPNVYIVPMVTSYHVVLEAASLIEDYLAEAGKHRFIIMDDESWEAAKVLSFYWKFFSSQSSLTVRLGRPLDVFGNFVDEEGRGIGPNGTTVDPSRWLSTGGEIKRDEQRDNEYTRELGRVLASRFHRENTVLTSHAVAFAYFEALRKRYPDLDLYRFLRLSSEQRSMQLPEFHAEAQGLHSKLLALEKRGDCFLSEELHAEDSGSWIRHGMTHLGSLHGAAVVKESDGVITSEDMPLLYYYRNRLAGYGLSLLARPDEIRGKSGTNDRKGFLE